MASLIISFPTFKGIPVFPLINSGVSFAIAGSAAAVGPLLAGLIREATGSYELAFQLGAGLNVAAILVLTVLRPPSRR